MARVLIVNKAGHDFSQAEKFGDLVPVTVGNINIFRPDRNLFEVGEALQNFDYKVDYLLLSGNVLANLMAASTLFLRDKIKSLKMLIYDAKNSEYIEHTITLDKTTKEMKFVRK